MYFKLNCILAQAHETLHLFNLIKIQCCNGVNIYILHFNIIDHHHIVKLTKIGIIKWSTSIISILTALSITASYLLVVYITSLTYPLKYSLSISLLFYKYDEDILILIVTSCKFIYIISSNQTYQVYFAQSRAC